jgi:hypothetical protein
VSRLVSVTTEGLSPMPLPLLEEIEIVVLIRGNDLRRRSRG